MIRLGLLALLAVGCAGTPSATPIVVYVTPPSPAQTLSTTAAPTAMPSTPTALHTMTVTITLFDPAAAGTIVSYGPSECAGWHAYSNIDAGMRATVQDADGTILGVAVFDHHGQSITKNGTSTTECRLTSTSVDVPESPLYAVDLIRLEPGQLGSGRLACLQFKLADVKASGWVAELTIGDKKSPRPPPTAGGSGSLSRDCRAG